MSLTDEHKAIIDIQTTLAKVVTIQENQEKTFDKLTDMMSEFIGVKQKMSNMDEKITSNIEQIAKLETQIDSVDTRINIMDALFKGNVNAITKLASIGVVVISASVWIIEHFKLF